MRLERKGSVTNSKDIEEHVPEVRRHHSLPSKASPPRLISRRPARLIKNYVEQRIVRCGQRVKCEASDQRKLKG